MKNKFFRLVSALLCISTVAALMIGVSSAAGIAGDVNRDGFTDNKDVAVLFRHLNGDKTEVDETACDTNGDGFTDNKDVVTLFRYLSGTPGVQIFYGKEDPEDEDLRTEIELPDYNFLNENREIVYNYGGSGASAGAFGLQRDARKSGDTVILPKDAVGGVYTTVKTTSEHPVVYTFRIKNTTSKTAATWFTSYFGCRLENEQDDPTVNKGVWIAMRNKQLGLRTSAWPETTYFDVSCDFSSGVLITVVDDPEENVIHIYAGENKKEIANVTVNGKNVTLKNVSSGKTISTKTSKTAVSGGYAHIWGHYVEEDVTVSNISVSSTIEAGVNENNGIKNNTRDVFADTWVAYDDNGREINTTEKKPGGAKVGIFYFLWHEDKYNKRALYDHTASYLSGGMDGLWNTMTSGSLGFAHYWAEPYFGYYSSNDEWVIRKHGAMLSEAGIDFVFFDTTNGLLYPTNYEAVLRVWSKMRAEGLKTPDVCFLMKEGDTAELSSLWTNLYCTNLYEDMWFRWNGKPVIMFTGSSNTLTDEQKNFFTVKYSWAVESDSWYRSRNGIDCWAWATMYPQKGGYAMVNGKRTLEQMVVMCGFWANGSYGTNAGRSYTYKTGEPKTSSGWDMGFALYPQTSGKGLAYQEQFDRAINYSPKILMITGWNEWWAGRWEGGGAVGQTVAYEYKVSSDSTKKEYNYYVDNLNPEYSRDLEPMRDGFKDNYYYQTVKNVREYKGGRQTEAAFGQKTVDINGSISQWLTVGPEFRDVYGDTAHRDHVSHVGNMRYTDDSGRNDIITAKVSSDDQYLYFYAECADKITAPQGENWMNLFIKTDKNNENGWYGFDYVINRDRSDNKASVIKFKNGWSFEKAGEAEYTYSGKTIVIKVKRSLIGYNGKSLDFKWADNSVDGGDIMEFLDKGDAAPDGRFCYRYTTEATETVIPDCLTDDMAVFKVNSYNAYIAGKSVRLYNNNTKAVLLASGYEYYLPVSVLQSLGFNCSGEKTYRHFGVSYVKADGIVSKSGKAVTITPDGLLVISKQKITDTETLDTLFRSLY